MANLDTLALSQYSCVCLLLFDDYYRLVRCSLIANLCTFKFSDFDLFFHYVLMDNLGMSTLSE